MQSARRFAVACFALACTGALASCASKPPPPPAPPSPTRAKGAIEVGANVNPDAHGRASPVVVRVYELTSPAIFNTADFFSLYERDRETLGPELVAVEELQLVPGEKRALDRTLQPTTRHLAVTAAFRQIERAQWRATMPVPLNKTTAVTVRLDGVTVSITAAP